MFWPPTNTVASKEKDGMCLPRETPIIPTVPSLPPPRLLNKVLTSSINPTKEIWNVEIQNSGLLLNRASTAVILIGPQKTSHNGVFEVWYV